MSAVAITGMALASPFGDDLDAFWGGVCHGPTPVTTWISEPDYPGLSCAAAVLPGAPRGGDRATRLAIDLARRALAGAGHAAPPAGCGLAIGSHWGNVDVLALPPRPPHPSMSETLARELALDGPVTLVPVACTAANLALAWAADRVRDGEAPLMIAGGLDVIGPIAVGTYLLFGNLTETLPRPFSSARDGMLVAEGGALFVLEPLEHARSRGARVLGILAGAGAAHDASHPTRPAPDGRGTIDAVRAALADARLEPRDIDYVNAHSPGTHANDPAEAAAYRAVFGARGVPVSSTKGALGHAQGGANALEAAACLLTLRHGLLPPTLNVGEPDPALDLDLILDGPRPAAPRHVLSAAASLGGACSAIVLGAGDPW